MKIACLHTAQSNVAVFDKAARALNLPQDALTHKVMPHLLEQAQAAGGVTPEIEKETIAALADLRTDADVVLLTCSTLGGAADFLAQDPGIMRVDRALAQATVTAGQPVVVLCARQPRCTRPPRCFVQHSRRPRRSVLSLFPTPGRCLRAASMTPFTSASPKPLSRPSRAARVVWRWRRLRWQARSVISATLNCSPARAPR